ncbi:FtsQ-type POTRA domain-containing protein [Nocardioides sp. cx-169]|uniref:cell division protein FtsQ/DivIB n=1 Tax=Nocardioides sp. cx-169 TaxID=2899080 RepID=UPI001E56736D|nr:FtsQ-type POTRA domain-containing protein [Nocardioides sp. cx-169]MCD4534766.1 FtsQ-type POTRA domain-containing protein [Nocardioides sp. cx-169]
MARGGGAGPDDEDRIAQQTRRRFVRRQWRRRWLVWKYVVSGLALVLLLGGGLYTVYLSDALAVDGVEVTGETTLSDDDVRAVARVPMGEPLARVDLDAIRARLAGLAVVRSVEVSRQWPHEVLIAIEERTAVAVVEIAGSLRGLDRDGVVFGTLAKAPAGLPRVQTSAETSGEALREAALVVAALPEGLAGRVDHVEVRTVDSITLQLQGGREVRWGSSAQSEEKARVLEQLLGQEAEEYYDVSVPGTPTLK